MSPATGVQNHHDGLRCGLTRSACDHQINRYRIRIAGRSKGRVRPIEQECSMLCHVLAGDLERDVKSFAKRRCKPGEYLVYRDQRGEIVAAFKSEDRAALFLNLFDEEIVRSFEDDIKRSAA